MRLSIRATFDPADDRDNLRFHHTCILCHFLLKLGLLARSLLSGVVAEVLPPWEKRTWRLRAKILNCSRQPNSANSGNLIWCVATHIEDVSREDLEERVRALNRPS